MRAAVGELKRSQGQAVEDVILPDLSLSGKILQRNVQVDSRRQQIEYYFQLTLTQLNTGLAIWEGETLIGKRGSSDAVPW